MFRVPKDSFDKMSAKKNTEIGFKDYLIFWFEDIYSERVENTTRLVGAYTLYDLILPHIEQDIKLRYINTEYLDSLLEMVAKSCASAGNKGREFLNMALKEAVIQGYIKVNPITGTRLYRRKKPTVTILSKEKLKVFLKVADKSNWYLEILLALFCGLRKGEIQGLKFTDFDMENKTVYIQRQIISNPIILKGNSKIESYDVIERAPKTENSYRLLRVPEIILEELKRNSLPHITVHGLRHMYATILIEQGVPLIKISALLGHSSVHTLLS